MSVSLGARNSEKIKGIKILFLFNLVNKKNILVPWFLSDFMAPKLALSMPLAIQHWHMPME